MVQKQILKYRELGPRFNPKTRHKLMGTVDKLINDLRTRRVVETSEVTPQDVACALAIRAIREEQKIKTGKRDERSKEFLEKIQNAIELLSLYSGMDRKQIICNLAAIANLNGDAFREIKEQLKHSPKWMVREGCAIVIGKTKRKDAEGALQEVYECDKDTAVRVACSKALEEIRKANAKK